MQKGGLTNINAANTADTNDKEFIDVNANQQGANDKELIDVNANQQMHEHKVTPCQMLQLFLYELVITVANYFETY